MTPALHMTRAQERRFYRDAVRASLETFYGKSKSEAAKLVRDWWARLIATKAFESGIFLHAEPVNTAANIAGARVIAITGENRTQYHRILDESRDLVLPKTMPLPSPARLKKLEAARNKQLLHFASSDASGSMRRTAVQNVAQGAEEKKSGRKYQSAYV
jgi:hypothetical protein